MEDDKMMVPPPAEADGSGDVELLKAISANPECAHVLAAIAAGGDPAELMATLLPPAPVEEEEAPVEDAPADEEEAAPAARDVALYQSAAVASQQGGEAYPSFLERVQDDFWAFAQKK